MKKEIAVRFMGKVLETDTCWMWQGHVANSGYGNFWMRGKTRYAHRVAYELAHGVIPDGLCIRHTCDVRSCVNPSHLLLGTYAENSADMVKRGRQAAGEANGNVRLSDAQVLDVRTSNESGVAVARRLGVSKSLISAIRRELIRRTSHG